MPPLIPSPEAPLLTVTNRVSVSDRGQDEIYEFTEDGQTRTFGRDDRACDIVIWQAHSGAELARVAGQIWRWDDELWVRNLAGRHEIGLIVPGQPPEQPLRRRLEGTRGHACSIPAPLASVVGPGGLLLEVQQSRAPVERTFTYGLEQQTLTVVPDVPEHLKALAVALCEPLLLGQRLPAAHSEVMSRISQPSLRILRNRIDELCGLYTAASPELAKRVTERKRRQEAAQAPMPTPVLRGAVFQYEESGAATETAASRAKTLSLPAYYEVAHLLVRHYRITESDLGLLPPRVAPNTGTT